MLRNGLHSHIITCRYASGLMVEQGSGLIVEIGDGDTLNYRQTLFYDLVKMSVSRLAYALAEELYKKRVAAVAITPGFMRTEAILESFGVTEANWRHAAENNPKAKSYGFIDSETPCFVGRAIAALAADPRVLEKSGGLYSSWGLARAYGFTDLDGSQPDLSQHFKFDDLFKSQTGFRWTITRPAMPQQE